MQLSTPNSSWLNHHFCWTSRLRGYPKCQESWELHDAVEVGGADLEERGDVAAFDQDPSYPGWNGWTMGY